ncbi:zinc finger MYM-type protein 1-like protein [Tanacetum coccineum]
MDDGSSCYAQKGDADSAYSYLKSFEFVFILHLMKEIMGKIDILCQALQKKSQDIFNAIELVSATNESLSEFKNNGWNSFFAQMRVFYEKHQIEIPDMSAPYKSTQYRPRNDQAMELLKLSSTLVPNRVFNIDDICLLVEKYYPADFTEQERLRLKYELELFSIERQKNTKLSGATTMTPINYIFNSLAMMEIWNVEII